MRKNTVVSSLYGVANCLYFIHFINTFHFQLKLIYQPSFFSFLIIVSFLSPFHSLDVIYHVSYLMSYKGFDWKFCDGSHKVSVFEFNISNKMREESICDRTCKWNTVVGIVKRLTR